MDQSLYSWSSNKVKFKIIIDLYIFTQQNKPQKQLLSLIYNSQLINQSSKSMLNKFISKGLLLKNFTSPLIKFTYFQDFDEHVIKPVNLRTPKEYYNDLYKNPKLNPFPKVRANYNDVLSYPGVEKRDLLEMQRQILIKGEVEISNQFIALLLYQMSKEKILLKSVMDMIVDWIPRHKGQYTAREIFGCMYGLIIYNRTDFFDFFIQQIQASELQFQFSQSLQIMEALNKNTHMTLQQKHKFWEDNFKSAFMDNLGQVRTKKVSNVLRIFDTVTEFQYYQDRDMWESIIAMLDKKGGWLRTAIIERLYPITGEFESAKQLFDKYYISLSTNRNVNWRYNLEELRLYTSEEMIAKSQENIQMNPTFKSLLPLDELDKLTKEYDDYLEKGAVKKEEEIISDKSASFGYAIKERFENMSKDGIDFSKMSREEFEELFGEYDEAMMKQQQNEGEHQEENQGEGSENQQGLEEEANPEEGEKQE